MNLVEKKNKKITIKELQEDVISLKRRMFYLGLLFTAYVVLTFILNLNFINSTYDGMESIFENQQLLVDNQMTIGNTLYSHEEAILGLVLTQGGLAEMNISNEEDSLGVTITPNDLCDVE